jgi:hypothetical protein
MNSYPPTEVKRVMATLVINAPMAKVQQQGSRSFYSTFKSSVGDEYAISASLRAQLSPGCKVVLLSTDEDKRAEGDLVKLVPKSKTKSGMQRYDVHIKNLKMVPYKPENINRYGVAVI